MMCLTPFSRVSLRVALSIATAVSFAAADETNPKSVTPDRAARTAVLEQKRAVVAARSQYRKALVKARKHCIRMLEEARAGATRGDDMLTP